MEPGLFLKTNSALQEEGKTKNLMHGTKWQERQMQGEVKDEIAHITKGSGIAAIAAMRKNTLPEAQPLLSVNG